jgi:hypothetical protein
MKDVIRITNDGWIERLDINTAELKMKLIEPKVKNENNNAGWQMWNTL